MQNQKTTKRTMRTPEAFVGKVIDFTKWNIPEGYAKCEMTGKFDRKDNLEVTFQHHAFEKSFLVENRIYVEDAAWLSQEGYDLILNTLDRLGMMDFFWQRIEEYAFGGKAA